MTLEELIEDPLRLDRSHVGALATPENLPRLRTLLSHADHDVVAAAAQLVGVVGDPVAVEPLARAGRELLCHEALEALLECGPEGRQLLARLCLERSDVGECAWEAVLVGLARPPVRPAIFQIMEDLALHPKAPQAISQSARRQLILHGWTSSWSKLAGIPEGLWLPGLFPAPRTARDSIAPPCRAALRRTIASQLREGGRRTYESQQTYKHELSRRRSQPALATPEVGRNDGCPCGSGKKYKKCCLDKELRSRRLDPWLSVDELTRWKPVGLLGLPTEYDELPPLLLESKPARLRVKPGDSPVKAWVIASRLIQLGDWEHGLQALNSALQETQPEGLDVELVLTWTVIELMSAAAWDYSSQLVPCLVAHGLECHLSLVGEMFASEPDQLFSYMDRLLERQAPLAKLLALVDAALSHGADGSVAEEFCEQMRTYYPHEPQAALVEAELRELVQGRLEPDSPFPDPHPSLPQIDWLRGLPLEKHPQLESFLAVLDESLTWPDAEIPVTADSLAPLEAELNLRRDYQGDWLGLIQEELAQLRQQVLGQRQDLWIAFTPHNLLWVLPDSISLPQACAVVAAAGTLQAELALQEPRVVCWQGCLGLEQPYGSCLAADLLLALPVALAEWQVEWEPQWTLLNAPLSSEGLDDPAEFPTLGNPDDPLMVRAQRANRHVLEHAAEGSASGRFHPFQVAQARPLAEGARRPLLPSVTVPELGLPMALEDDPQPARKALRKVLRRLLRLNKVGEAHTAVDLVSRGVRGHLRGQVREAVLVLLARGILRDKPTLKCQHTSIEPKHLPKVHRFIEQGWLPHPDLAAILEV